MATETTPATGPQHTTTAGPRRSFVARFRGALLLDASVYEEVEHDSGALGQAFAVVAIVALAQGLGTGVGAGAIVSGFLAAVVGWVLSTAIVWAIGVKAMNHTSDFAELLRTLGFASAPKVVLLAGAIPLAAIGWLAWLAATVLSVLAFVIAVRQALDVTTGRAVFVCVLAVGMSIAIGLLAGGLSTVLR